MDIIIIALVCSQLGVPDHANCMIDTATRTERIEPPARNNAECEFNGMAMLADKVGRGFIKIDMRTEYIKVMCVQPSHIENHGTG